MHLASMIKNSKDSEFIYIYPKSTNFNFNYRSGKYLNYIELKNMLFELEQIILNNYLNLPFTNLSYEKTQTKIHDYIIDSDFYFNTNENILTESILSKKPTSIKINKNFITTLAFQNNEQLLEFLNLINLLDSDEEIPLWVQNIAFFNDTRLNETIQENSRIIEAAETKINEAKSTISLNNLYKSILYSTGDKLVSVVFKILEQILNCSLNGFEDKKKEDFLIELDNVNLIGEIKGVSPNVKSIYISQLDVHYHKYLENKKNLNPDKAILVICHQRNKDPDVREQIHLDQIELAIRNKSLIIETTTLLSIYEEFLMNKITTEEILSILSNEVGLLKFSKK